MTHASSDPERSCVALHCGHVEATHGLFLFAVSVHSAFAQEAAGKSWVGSWKLDRSASHFVGFVVIITHLQHSCRFELEGASIEVGDDGKDYATFPTRTTSFKQLSENHWARTHKINGKVVDSSISTLSPDARSFVIHTIAVDDVGKKHEFDEAYKRERTGSGIDGTWRSTSGGVNTSEEFNVSAGAGGALIFNYPKEQFSFTTHLDGSPVRYSGAHALPSVRIAVSTVSPRQLRWTDFLNGHPYMQGKYALSSDGKKFTETSWHATRPSDKDEAVYVRE